MNANLLDTLRQEKERISIEIDRLTKELDIVDEFINKLEGIETTNTKTINTKSDTSSDKDSTINDSKAIKVNLTQMESIVFSALKEIGGKGTKADIVSILMKEISGHDKNKSDNTARNYLPRLFKKGLLTRMENKQGAYVYKIKK